MVKIPDYIKQTIPIFLTFVVFAALSALLFLEINILNKLQWACHTKEQCLSTNLFLTDILVGMTIYLKTSVDFALFIGNLMHSYPTWKNRIAIEIGTALGNALGTIVVLAMWSFFKEIKWLLAVMIAVAALVLLKLAEEGLEHALENKSGITKNIYDFSENLKNILNMINKKTDILLSKIIPNLSMKPKAGLSFWGLFVVSFTVPFILGLDDFAGYVPVFNIVNVFGFSVGVILGHMILNLSLFLSPKLTIRAVKNSYIALVGSIAFIALSFWGMFEVYKLIFLEH